VVEVLVAADLLGEPAQQLDFQGQRLALGKQPGEVGGERRG
jgi:hypothetical protein